MLSGIFIDGIPVFLCSWCNLSTQDCSKLRPVAWFIWEISIVSILSIFCRFPQKIEILYEKQFWWEFFRRVLGLELILGNIVLNCLKIKKSIFLIYQHFNRNPQNIVSGIMTPSKYVGTTRKFTGSDCVHLLWVLLKFYKIDIKNNLF